nr:MAG TPA: hypothetical protein [Caudoviricetes sp.]
MSLLTVLINSTNVEKGSKMNYKSKNNMDKLFVRVAIHYFVISILFSIPDMVIWFFKSLHYLVIFIKTYPDELIRLVELVKDFFS